MPMREYERTHPFISFKISMERAPAKLWILLGEAQSKCEHLQGVPLPLSVQKDLTEDLPGEGRLRRRPSRGTLFPKRM